MATTLKLKVNPEHVSLVTVSVTTTTSPGAKVALDPNKLFPPKPTIEVTISFGRIDGFVAT